MSQQVLYSTVTSEVLQWQDTDKFSYTAPPSGTDTLAVTAEEWASQSGTWYVVNGALTQTDPNAFQKAQTSQIALLRTACQSAITGGFTSSALGSAYNYPSDPTSQSNLNTVAGSPSGGSLWCESGGVWAMKAHTQSQAQAVLTSFVAWLNSCQSQLATLTAEVNAATTVSAVQAITWTAP